MNPSTTAPDLRVGFIGAGQMGRPMVDRLVTAGQGVTVFARRAETRDELTAAGIAVTGHAAELAASVDVLIVCVFSDAQLRELLLDDGVVDDGVVGALQPGATLVSHVTGSPDLVAELADRAPLGVHVVDAPMSGTADQIRAGRLTLLLGGDEADIERVRPVLAAYADPIIHVGAIGDAQRVKLINNLLFTVNLRMAVDAARLAEAMSVTPNRLADTLATCSGNSFALALFQHLQPEALVATARPFLAKDVAVVREVAASLGLDLGLLGELSEWVNDG